MGSSRSLGEPFRGLPLSAQTAALNKSTQVLCASAAGRAVRHAAGRARRCARSPHFGTRYEAQTASSCVVSYKIIAPERVAAVQSLLYDVLSEARCSICSAARGTLLGMCTTVRYCASETSTELHESSAELGVVRRAPALAAAAKPRAGTRVVSRLPSGLVWRPGRARHALPRHGATTVTLLLAKEQLLAR